MKTDHTDHTNESENFRSSPDEIKILKDKKNSLRKSFREKRNRLDPATIAKKSEEMAQILSKRPEFLYSQKIAAYISTDFEIDPSFLMEKAWQLGKKCYLPILHPLEERLMFLEFQKGDPLVANRFGILEPCLVARSTQDTQSAISAQKIIPAWALELVLTPLVAFDIHGHRLGMGKGYYDKTFDFLSSDFYSSLSTGNLSGNLQERKPGYPRLIGLGYEEQCADHPLPHLPSDIPLIAIATEKRVIIPGIDSRDGNPHA